MALSNHDQARIREYLLGHLNEEEQQKIEERLMVEDDLFQELEVSTDELIHEYRAGELPEDDRIWFGCHYLASPEGKRANTFAAALDCLKRPTPAPQPLTLWERLESFIKGQRLVIAAATSAALVAAIVVSLQFSRPRTSIAITLNSTVVNRSANNTRYPEISLKPDTGEVRISLKLPESETRGVDYRAELDNRQEIKSLKPSAHDTDSVLVVIPARQLPPGLYALTLFEIANGGEEQQVPGTYFFVVK